MHLYLDKSQLDVFLQRNPRLNPLRDQLRLGSRAKIAYDSLHAEELESLIELFGAETQRSMHSVLIKVWHELRSQKPPRYQADQLEQLLPEIALYLLTDAQRGWLFRVHNTGYVLPYLVTRLDYTPPGEEESGRILLDLKANSQGKLVNEMLVIRARDLCECSIAEIFAAKGYLKETLIRAQRWGAVMLIDEADVYIKRRSDSLASNAVVGVFLRVLEYFNGLLFLTTNRIDDIHEAIISRCIAVIRYHAPGYEDRCKIWRVMTSQFALPVTQEVIEQLAIAFPDATGRDIKGLSKLVAKFCQQKRQPPDLAMFRHCAIFRGLKWYDPEPD